VLASKLSVIELTLSIGNENNNMTPIISLNIKYVING